MCREVGSALFRALADAGVTPAYDALTDQYREEATALVEQYATDAAFNGLDHDATAEREQVATYADAIEPPEADTRLPAWEDAPLTPANVLDRSRAALEDTL